MNDSIYNFNNSLNHKNIKNNENILKIQKDILKEIKLQQNSLNKLFVIRNIYPQKNNKFILDIYIKNSKNQNDSLINHVKNLFYQYPILLNFINNNFSSNNLNKPLSIEFYYTNDFRPIILINKRGFHLIDLITLLEKSTHKLTPKNFTFTSKNKIF